MLKLSAKQILIHSIRTRKFGQIRPLYLLSVAFAAGIGVSFAQRFEFVPVLVACVFILVLSVFFRRRLWFIPFITCFFFMLGILYGTNDQIIPVHHIALAGRTGFMVLEGKVISVPEMIKHGKKETLSFVLEVQSFYKNGGKRHVTGKVQAFFHNCECQIDYGNLVRVRGYLEEPKQKTNPHVFDYSAYLSNQGITKIFRSIGTKSIVFNRKPKSQDLFVFINQIRVHIRNRIYRLISVPCADLANALILGFRKNIPEEIKEDFIKTGTAHLIAISGFNISLIAGLFYFLISFLRIPRVLQFFMTLVLILVYTVLAGAQFPVLRAGIMGTLVFAGFLMKQERNLTSALFNSFLWLLVWDPSALFSGSFQLSFLAMGALIFILPKLQKLIRFERESERPFPSGFFHSAFVRIRYGLMETLLGSFAVTLGMFPVLVWYFYLFSPVGFLTNLIAIPVCTLAIASTLVLLLLDVICFPAASVLAFIPTQFYKLEIALIHFSAKIPFGYFYLPKPNAIFLILYYGILLIWVMFFKRSVIRRLGLVVLLLISFISLVSLKPAGSRYVFFDVNKSDAFLILFSNGSKCLVNAGRHFPNNQAYWILKPYFMASGIGRIDGILFTQLDASSTGGYETLKQAIRMGRVFIPQQFKTSKFIRRIRKSEIVKTGDRIQFGGQSSIEIISAVAGRIQAFVVHDARKKVLFIMSFDKQVAEALANLGNLKFDFIYLAHADSFLSPLEKEFLSRVKADYFIINQREDLKKYLEQIQPLTSAQLFPMAELGAIEVIGQPFSPVIRHYRQTGISSAYFSPN